MEYVRQIEFSEEFKEAVASVIAFAVLFLCAL